MLSVIWKVWLLLLLIHTVASWPSSCEEDQTFCSIGLCLTPECIQCSNYTSVCETSSVKEPIPSTLPNTTNRMLLFYGGPSTALNSSMFAPYPDLKNVTLCGNFVTIAPATFRTHQYLSTLSLKDTQISYLPSDLFHDSSHLNYLLLPNNKFAVIPENVFHSILNVKTMDLSYNPIDICNKRSIGEQFTRLPNLSNVSLAGLGANLGKNCVLSKSFLKPLARVHKLDLSESHILQRNPLLLKSLAHVHELYLNRLESYMSCPSLANELFKNLPPNITKVYVEGWKANYTIQKSCALNKTSFDSLRGSKLAGLSFRYSDKILGDRLTAQVFDHINLTSLDLTWCRLSSFDEDAFDSLEHLSDLSLEGNQLGPREFKLFTTPKFGLELKSLQLASIGAFSDEDAVYPMGRILEHSPNIKMLIMSRNLMTRLPSFSTTDTESSIKTSYEVLHFIIDDNQLKDLSQDSTKEFCNLMPKLQSFSAKNNRLSDITGLGLCSSVKEIKLAFNKIGGTNEVGNLQAVKLLVRLTILDLRSNGIQQVPGNLTWQMPNLEMFYMGDNQIHVLPQRFFHKNRKLTFIDLSHNLSTSIDQDLFVLSEQLTMIHLHNNLLMDIPRMITKGLDQLANIRVSNSLVSQTHSPSLIFDFSENPIDCSCGTEHFQEWVLHSPIVANVRHLKCSEVNEQKRKGNLVYNHTQKAYLCKLKTPMSVVCSLLSTIVVALIGIKVYQNWWYVTHLNVVLMSAKHIKIELQSEYDALLSYDENNVAVLRWVLECLITQFEGRTIGEVNDHGPAVQALEGAFRLYITERSSLIGSEKYTELGHAIEDSRKLIIILSNSYLASPVCRNEANYLLGYQTDKVDCYHPNRILILELEELNREIITPPITGLLQLPNVVDVTPRIRDHTWKMNLAWGRIRKFISKPSFKYVNPSQMEDEPSTSYGACSRVGASH